MYVCTLWSQKSLTLLMPTKKYQPASFVAINCCMQQVMSKDLKEHGYYKEKGVVEKVVSKYLGQIAMLKSGDVLQVRLVPCLQGEDCSLNNSVSIGRQNLSESRLLILVLKDRDLYGEGVRTPVVEF